MFAELGVVPSQAAVARQYADFLDGLIVDTVDAAEAGVIQGLATRVVPTVMKTAADKADLARACLAFAAELK